MKALLRALPSMPSRRLPPSPEPSPAAQDSSALARGLAEIKRSMGKPLLSCWMGDASVVQARVLLNEAAIPTFRTPEAAVGAFGNIATFYQNQRLLQQTPPPLSTLGKPDIEGARLVLIGPPAP